MINKKVFWFGRKHTNETIEKMKDKKRGINHPFYGKKHTNKTKEKIGLKTSSLLRGRKISETHRLNIIKSLIGRKLSDKTKKKISESHSGNKNYNWLEDRSKLKKQFRYNYEYLIWSKKCKDRDGKKCMMKNDECNGRLEIHHILNFKDNPKLRYDVSNGITLCHFHHPKGRVMENKMVGYLQELIK